MRTKLAINPVTGELDLVTRVNFKQVEIDFGPDGKHEKTFTISDPFIDATSLIIGEIAFVSSTDKEQDEPTMDAMSLRFSPGVGQFDVFISALEGRVYGTFKFNYAVM